MELLKQSTAFTETIGPILDSAGAEYTGAVIGDLSISKNGTEAAMAAAATLTHISNGHYTLVGTTGNTDTLGRLTIRVNKATYQMPTKAFMVLPANVYDSLVGGSDTLQADVTQWNGTNVATPDTAGYPKVTIKIGTGTGEVSLSSGQVVIDAASRREIARIVATHNNVYWVSKSGNDSNDGYTPSTAKLTISAGLGLASAGDAVIVLPGTYALAGTSITVPADVSLIGSGVEHTIITHTRVDATVAVVVNGGSRVENLSITSATSPNVELLEYDFPLGRQTALSNTRPIVIRNVRVTGYRDCLYFYDPTTPTPTVALTLLIDNCQFHTGWDWLLVRGYSSATVEIRNCHCDSNGSHAVDQVIGSIPLGLSVDSTNVAVDFTIVDTTIRGHRPSFVDSLTALVCYLKGAGRYLFRRCRVENSSANSLDYSISAASGCTVLLSDSSIESTTGAGTFTYDNGGTDWANITNKTSTNNLTGTTVKATDASGNNIPTAAQNAAGLLDLAAGVETGLTPREALRLIAAALAGKLSGADGTTITIRNAVADSKARITATVDASGNRSAITTDLT